MLNKKCISPVITVTLLLIVVIVAIGILQGWFSSYQNRMIANVESQIYNNCIVTVEALVGDKLYLRSKCNQELKFLELRNQNGDKLCSFEGVNNEGLVLWLPFERIDTKTNTTPDVSGRGNDAKLKDANITNGVSLPQLTTANCPNSKCLLFNGVDSYIEMTGKRDFDFVHTDNFTMLVSVSNYKYALGEYKVLFQKAFESYLIQLLTSNRIYSQYDGAKFGHGSIYELDDNHITQIVNVWDGSMHNNSIYVNGVFDSSKDGSVAVWTATYKDLRFGISDNGWHYAWNGTADDIRIYSRILSAKEINDSYRNPSMYLFHGMNILNLSRGNCNLVNKDIIDVFGYTSNNYFEDTKMVK